MDIAAPAKRSPDAATTAPETAANPRESARRHGQIVMVFQGGGALGAYQAGVYQAMHEADIEPDWVIGTSIGAINASLIAGNAPADRLERLREFWRRVEHTPLMRMAWSMPLIGGQFANWMATTAGVRGFFTPNPSAFLSPYSLMEPEQAGYYSTSPLAANLAGLVDLSRLGERGMRLTVGAANVRTADMCYFDSREMDLTLDHILASGALPPAFPPVRINGELYWDGGILSNTPVEAVFDDMPRRDSLIFAVHLWNPAGTEPNSIWKVLNRQKDLQYASRADTHIKRQRQIHKLRHLVAELAMRLPEAERKKAEVRAMAAYGCVTRMHVVRLRAPQLDGEDHSKDIDFSAHGIRARWDAGYADTMRVLEAQPWEHEGIDPMEGFILHEPAMAP